MAGVSAPIVETCGCRAVIGTVVEAQTRYGSRPRLLLAGSTMPVEHLRGECPECGATWCYDAPHVTYQEFVRRRLAR